MGTSKSYREGPGWTKENVVPRGKYDASTGVPVHPEGTAMSGEDDWGRKGMSNTARKKSKAGTTPFKAKVTTGES